MADYFTSWHVLKLKRKKGIAWQGVLSHSEPNPAYIEDPRTPEQRRKSFGKTPNTLHVEDPRTPEQRQKTITSQVRKVFDPATVTTKAQATEALAKWREEMEREHANPDAKKTVSAYVEHYIEVLETLFDPTRTGTSEHSGISPTTARDYRGSMRYFGRGKPIAGVQLRNLTSKTIEDWELSLLRSGLSGTTVAKAHRLLWSALEYAVNRDDLRKNPARGVKTPRRTSGNRPNALDAEGRGKAMAALRAAEPTQAVVAAQIALYLGMRRGEVCALTWADVDLKGVVWKDHIGGEVKERGPKVRVVQSVAEGPGGTYLKAPKSSAGVRVLALKGGLVDVLEERRAKMMAEWSEALSHAGIIPTETAFGRLFVVGTVAGGYYTPATFSREWASFAKEHGLVGTEGRVVTVHGLRDSFATAALTRGEDIGTIANSLGHADPALTLRRYATGRDSTAQAKANETVAEDLDAASAGTVLPFRPRTGTDD